MKTRKLSISTRLFLLFSLLVLSGVSALGCLSYTKSKEALFTQIQSNAKNIASCAAANIDGEILKEITAGDEDTEQYNTVLSQLITFRDNAELEYIYTLQKHGTDDFFFVVDSDPDEPAAIGDECETTAAMLFAYNNSETLADEETVADEWGVHLSAYSPILDGIEVVGLVGVDVSATWIAEQIASLRNLILIVSSAVFIVSFICLYFLIKQFRNGVIKLNDKVKELRSGNGDLTKRVDIKSGDELEVVAENMNCFLEQVRKLVKDVAASTKLLGEAGTQLGDTISENLQTHLSMNDQIEEITASMEESAASSQIMVESLSDCREEIESFTKSVSQIARNSKNAKIRANEVFDIASKNRERSLTTMEDLKVRIKKTSEDIQKIQQVQAIAEEVSKIAGQTNILSLNASIEAARAGEQGKGFAVVAGQVGKLSLDINKAVSQINQINEQILLAAKVLSETTENFTRFITEDVANDYNAFASMCEEYGKTTAFVESEMSRISEESNVIFEKINNVGLHVDTIAEMVRSTSEGAVKLATSTSQLSQNMETLSEASRINIENSQSLNAEIAKYRY